MPIQKRADPGLSLKIGIFGTGEVGRTLAAALVRKGHDVVVGTRNVRRKMEEKAEDEESESFRDWLGRNAKVRLGTFAEAAGHGGLLINATAGHASLKVLAKARPADLNGKILIDVSNALGPWGEGPLQLFVANTDSLAERIQRAHPGLKVVKALNTVSAHLMVKPKGLAGGGHDVFVAGNDPEARSRVARFLRDRFGWKAVIDLGDLTAARAMEMMIIAWVKIWTALGTDDFNYKIAR